MTPDNSNFNNSDNTFSTDSSHQTPVMTSGAETTSTSTGPGGVPVADPVFPHDFSLDSHSCGPIDGESVSDRHWEGVIAYLNSLGNKELARRWQKARQIMHEHGMAYNIFGRKEGTERPWEPDPVPYPVAAGTWEFLERGIAQRMRLMSAIFSDVYGPQKLIRNGHLPPELFFANDRFLRQCHGLYPEDAMFLHFHAVNLCRFPGGTWQVLSDLTQTPAGAGYALENRIVLSRILPRMFHSGKVLRLAPFFKSLLKSLIEISGMNKREPSIVMLSSGPSSALYFEHVFLSRYLGLPLVESSDLTVRNDSVFIKTLGGLHPVDVILRSIEDTACDPLVFSRVSFSGISGLVQAVRSGSVVVVNPLGSSVLETPGLVPFLPGLCRLILDEDLVLEDVPTLWCGQDIALKAVLSRIEDNSLPLIISSAFARSQIPTVDTRQLSREKKSDLMARIKGAPYAYVGRDPMIPCSLPVWEKGHLKSGFPVMKMFATALNNGHTDGPGSDSFAAARDTCVMPGGLTLTSEMGEKLLVDTGAAQGSKDTWCFSEKTAEYQSMMHHFTERLEIHRGGDLSSRVADNMLWLGRYAERAEGLLRVLRAVLSRLNSETPLKLIEELPFLLRCMGTLDICDPGKACDAKQVTLQALENDILGPLFKPGHPGNIEVALSRVKQVAARVRDRLSNDSWNILGRMEKELRMFSPHSRNRITEAQELINELILTISAFAGLALESMTRSMGWRFMDMGRRLERAGYMITLLKSLFHGGRNPSSYELDALLEVADSTITYHTRYRTTLVSGPVVDLLLLDELNPRAVGFQTETLADHVKALPHDTAGPFRTKEEKIMLELTTQLRLADIHTLMENQPDGKRPELTRLLDRLDRGLQALSEQITQHYLTRVETEKQLGSRSDAPVSQTSFLDAERSQAHEV